MSYKKVRVGALIYDKEFESILLLYRFHDGVEYYCTVGGTVEDGENSLESIIREVFEEVNIQIKNPKLIFEYDHDKYIGQHEMFFFVDEFVGEIKLGQPELSRLSPTNIYKPIWVPSTEIKNIKLLPPKIKKWLLDNLSVLK